MLYIHDYSPAETRWVPFASTHLSSSDEVLTFDEVRDRDEVDGVEVDERELMFVDLVEQKYERLEWARDKVILLVGEHSALKAFSWRRTDRKIALRIDQALATIGTLSLRWQTSSGLSTRVGEATRAGSCMWLRST